MNRGNHSLRLEMIIGLLLLALFGIFNTIINAPEFIKGFTFALAISLILVGGMKKESYKKLKGIKKCN